MAALGSWLSTCSVSAACTKSCIRRSGAARVAAWPSADAKPAKSCVVFDNACSCARATSSSGARHSQLAHACWAAAASPLRKCHWTNSCSRATSLGVSGAKSFAAPNTRITCSDCSRRAYWSLRHSKACRRMATGVSSRAASFSRRRQPCASPRSSRSRPSAPSSAFSGASRYERYRSVMRTRKSSLPASSTSGIRACHTSTRSWCRSCSANRRSRAEHSCSSCGLRMNNCLR